MFLRENKWSVQLRDKLTILSPIALVTISPLSPVCLVFFPLNFCTNAPCFLMFLEQYYLGFFSYCWYKIHLNLTKINLEGQREYFTFRVESIMQGHQGSSNLKQLVKECLQSVLQWMHVCCFSACFLCFSQSRVLCQRMIPPTIKMCLAKSINVIKIISHRHDQRPGSHLILDSFKLSIMTTLPFDNLALHLISFK